MLVSVILVICLIFLFIRKMKDNSEYWKKRNITYVSGIPWEFMKGKQSLSEFYKEIYNAFPKLPYVGIFVGTTPALILRDVKNVQAALHGDFESFYARGFLPNETDVLADNLLFTEDYNRWKLLRKRIPPFFNTTNLQNMYNVIEKCARDFIHNIEEKYQLETPFNALYSYNAACISSAVFGYNKECWNTIKAPLGEMAYKSLTPTLKLNLKLGISTISPTLFKWLNIKPFGVYEDLFIQLTKTLMEIRRNDRNTYHNFVDTCLKFEEEGALKDFVTGYETDTTLKFLAAQAYVFVLAGIDNSVNVMHMTLLQLSSEPKILQKVHDEIDEIFKNNGGTLTLEDVDKLEYMDKVIKEGMRRFPPVGVLQRRCCKDTVLPVGGVKVEKDTLVFIPIYALHRDENYYPNPEVFDPERFSAENITKIRKYSYLPFGEGKRNCIGTKFARIQMKTGLARLLREYTIKEQSLSCKFQPSFFGLRDSSASYEFVKRNHDVC